MWRDDSELFPLIREKLFTAVVGDVLDVMGLRNQFLPARIRPLHDSMVLIGRAMTVVETDLTDPDRAGRKPFGMMLEALDDLRAGEIYVATGGSPEYALWGELMSTRAIHLGATGAVLNGFSRDTPGILALKFPTFSYGPYAQDQAPRGEVIDFRVPIEIGQVRIAPGDLILGDVDGVLAVPRAAEDEALRRAFEKASKENQVRIAIENGMSAVEAFRTYGVM